MNADMLTDDLKKKTQQQRKFLAYRPAGCYYAVNLLLKIPLTPALSLKGEGGFILCGSAGV